MSDDEKEIHHESFGVVRLNRTSGDASLFGSSIRHQNYITLTICKAYAARDDCHYDKIYSDKEIIQVAMSGIQLGDMLTNMNVHAGTPCTIQRMFIDDKYVSLESPPESTSTKKTYVDEFKQKLRQVAASLKGLRAAAEALEDGKSSKADRKALTGRIDKIETELVSNLPFIQEMFNENVEKVTQEAKGEVEAFQSALIQNLGVKALAYKHAQDLKELEEEK